MYKLLILHASEQSFVKVKYLMCYCVLHNFIAKFHQTFSNSIRIHNHILQICLPSMHEYNLLWIISTSDTGIYFTTIFTLYFIHSIRKFYGQRMLFIIKAQVKLSIFVLTALKVKILTNVYIKSSSGTFILCREYLFFPHAVVWIGIFCNSKQLVQSLLLSRLLLQILIHISTMVRQQHHYQSQKSRLCHNKIK